MPSIPDHAETIVRLALPHDLPDVVTMIHALAAHHGDTALVTLQDLTRDVCGPQPWMHLLVVARGQALLGYAALIPLAQLQFGVRGMDMHHLFVRAQDRDKGCGKMMIQACIDHAKANGCRYLSVGTAPENVTAQNIYRAVGFDDSPPPGPRYRIKW